MDSLDALPSAEYASLLTLPPPAQSAHQHQLELVGAKAQPRHEQDHIYDQVSQFASYEVRGGRPHARDAPRKLEANANKILVHNTYVLKNPSKSSRRLGNVGDVHAGCATHHGTGSAATRGEGLSSCKKSDATSDLSVFSISGRRVIVSSNFKGNVVAKSEGTDAKERNQLNRSPSLWSAASTQSQVENKRRKLQSCTECCSLCLFVPGTVLCFLSPWLFVPIYVIPNFSENHFQILVWITCVCSAVLVFMGCFIGNVVWYKKGLDWKCLLHCGKGPKNHYWGDSLTSRPLHTV